MARHRSETTDFSTIEDAMLFKYSAHIRSVTDVQPLLSTKTDDAIARRKSILLSPDSSDFAP